MVITQLYSQAKAKKSSKTCMVAIGIPSACSFHLLKEGYRAMFNLRWLPCFVEKTHLFLLLYIVTSESGSL
jgi:hypothetical protein